MGSFFGNIGNAIKKAGTDTGHLVGKVASNPITQGLTAAALAATGVGAPAAAAILAAQHGVGNLIKPGGNLKGAVTGAGQGALLGGAAGLAGGVGLGGLKNAAGSLASHLPGVGSLAGAAGKLVGGGSSDGGFSLSSLLDPALGAAQGINAANLQKQSTNYATGALDTAQKSYDQRAPLRTAGVAGMLNPGQGIDLSSLKKTAGRNSFAA